MLDAVFENNEPVVVTYAEAGLYVLHQAAPEKGARPIDLGVFDNEVEFWICFCLTSQCNNERRLAVKG